MMQAVSSQSTSSWLAQWQRMIDQISIDAQGWWQLNDELEPATWFTDLSTEQQLALSQRRLQDWLYQQLISGVTYEAEPEHCDRRFNGLDLDFATELHSHNQGIGYWDEGWQIVGEGSDGYWSVTQQDLTIDVLPGEHLRAGVEPQADRMVEVKMPKNLVDADRYIAVGNAGKPVGARVQIYVHCDRAGVLPLMQSVTASLNQRSIPFTLAVPYDPFEYPRWDAGILVLEQADWQDTPPLSQAWGQYRLAGEPLLAKPIAQGMALVELDAETVRFGWERCRLIAEAISAASQTGQDYTQSVCQYFVAKGLNFTQPYRRSGRVNSL